MYFSFFNLDENDEDSLIYTLISDGVNRNKTLSIPTHLIRSAIAQKMYNAFKCMLRISDNSGELDEFPTIFICDGVDIPLNYTFKNVNDEDIRIVNIVKHADVDDNVVNIIKL